MKADAIVVEALEISAHVGVPDEEIANAQRLTVSLTLEPRAGFSHLHDDIARAVDYFQVCQRVKQVAAERPRRLIETLAEDIARALIAGFDLATVEIELRKFILPDTKHVAVRLRRSVPVA